MTEVLSIHLTTDNCEIENCDFDQHQDVQKKILPKSNWYVLMAGNSSLQMGEIAKIKLILREQMSPNNMFVSSFFDNSGEIKTVTPLILELGWLRPEFATGPLVVSHQKYCSPIGTWWKHNPGCNSFKFKKSFRF